MTKHSIAAICALSVAVFGFAPKSLADDAPAQSPASAPSVTSLTGDDGKDVKETKDVKEQVKESCITATSA